MDIDPGVTLARDVLNALSANIAVIDARGVIVAVNDAWIRFAHDNGSVDERAYVGADYLAVCENALAGGADHALEATSHGLRSLLAGASDELSMEYPCDSPTERRWFQLRATRLAGESGGAAVVAHEDITQRKQIEQAHRETERTLRSVLDALPVGVWIMNRSGRIVHGNPAGRQIWEGARYVGPEEFGQYKGWWLSTGLPIAAEEWAAARAILKGETSIGEEVEIECFDGARKIILNSAIPLLDEHQSIHGAIVVNQDITSQKRGDAELRRAKERVEATSRELAAALDRERTLARVDDLTGTINRRHFFELADRAVSEATRYGHPLALIMFDIDDFKRTNDTLGHQAGDHLLKRVAQSGRTHLRETDIFARYGGDEFVAVLPHTRAREAVVVAERMRADLAAQSIVLREGVMSVTISSGIAELLPQDDTLSALIHRADVALYQAKNAGRNRTTLFSAEMR
jgi:diguanylate cyclase (GGDEF)-like protein